MASTEPEEQSRPTLHHLNDSQSQRILWLLEELDIEYNLILHQRDPKQHRAPTELASISSLGKSPTLVTADGRVITESVAIASYLLKTFDTKEKFTTQDWIRDEQLTSFAGATLGPIMLIELFLDIAVTHTPFPFGLIARGIRRLIGHNFILPEISKCLKWLELELGEQEWFNGERIGRSDFILSWPLDLVAHRKWLELTIEFPKLAAFRERVKQRSAWKRGLEKGNGYDLGKW